MSEGSHKTQMDPEPCPMCKCPAMFFWVREPELFCEKCLNRMSLSDKERKGLSLRIAVQRNTDGDDPSQQHTTFTNLREYIDECLTFNAFTAPSKFLTNDALAIWKLIRLLEQQLPAPQGLISGPNKASRLAELKGQKADVVHRLEEIHRLFAVKTGALPMSERQEFRKNLELGRRQEPELTQLSLQIDEEIERILNPPVDPKNAIQERAVIRLKTKLASWKPRKLKTASEATNLERVNWRMLPPGHTWQEILNHYEGLQRRYGDKYDTKRLQFVNELKPTNTLLGEGEFVGYVAFVFDRGQGAVVLDCPLMGNAIYIMSLADWKRLSQLSKTELLREHGNEIRRVIHSRNWLIDLKFALVRWGVVRDYQELGS